MATLTGQSIASSYEQLLHIDNDGGGDGTTHVSVKDGDNGTTFSFTIATDALMMTSTNRLEFGDTGTYINQSSDGVLNITSDTEVEINATTIDINGAVAMNGAITGGTNITISGELDAATLDISGNADIDGTTNLDAVDIDGAVQIDAAFTSGVDGQGYDTKFFGDTSGAYMMWDTSADDLIFVGAAGIDLAGDIDVDGTANLDIVDIDGAVDMASTLTLAGNADFNGDLDVDGTANLDNTDIDGTLVVDGSNISLDSTATLNIDNSNTSNGITIGTATSAVPISIGHTTSETTINDNLTVTGDFTVNGTTTTINSTTMQVDDKMIELAHSPSGSEGDDAAVDGGGFTLKSSDSDKTILWENDDDSWHYNQGLVIGSDGSGHDVIFYSGTAGDNFTWDASEECLIITGTDAAQALKIADGDLVVVDKIYLYDNDGGEYLHGSSDGHLEINAGTTLDITAPTVDLNSATEFNIDTAAYDLNASGAVTIDGAGVSIDGTDDANFTVTGSGKDILLYATGGGAQQIQIVSAGTGSDAIELDAQEGGITVGLGGGAGDDFIVNSTTLVVESDNSRVGIGTASPSVTLDVSGAFGVSGAVGLASASGVTTIGSSNGLTVSAAGVLTVNSATDSSSSTSGSTIIDGGVGIAKKLYVGTILNNATAANLATASGITTIGSSTALTVSAAGVLTVNSTTDATNSTSGSTIIDGGVGIAKKLFVGTDLDVDGTANLDAVDIDGDVDISGSITNAAWTGDVIASAYLDADTAHLSTTQTFTGAKTFSTDMTLDRTGNQASFNIKSSNNNATQYFYKASTLYAHLEANDSKFMVSSRGSVPLLLSFDQSTKMKLDTNSSISLSNNDSGTSNTIFGKSAGASLDAGSNYNVFIGEAVSDASMNDSSRGVGVGYSALSAQTSGDDNIGIGYQAGVAVATGGENIFIGKNAGLSITASDGCVIIGHEAGDAINHTDANHSTLVGYAAGGAITEGRFNTAIGGFALDAEDDGDFNTAVGYQALTAQTGTSGDVYNTAVGYGSGIAVTKGKYNTILGARALTTDTVGDGSTAVGYNALYMFLTGGSDNDATGNTGLGHRAGLYNVTGLNNTYLGYNAGAGVSTKSHSGCIFIGTNAGATAYTGNDNIAIGVNAMDDVDADATVGGSNNNLFMGTNSGGGTWVTAASNYNVAIGNLSMDAAMNGALENTAVGYNALSGLTTGDYNVAIGRSGLASITASDGNTAVGTFAGQSLAGGVRNTLLGYSALGAANGDEDYNVCLGYYAGGSIDSDTADNNVLIGFEAGVGGGAAMADCVAIGSGAMNSTAANAQTGTIAIGSSALTALTSGGGNTVVGYLSADAMTDGYNNVALGNGALGASVSGQSMVAVGYGAMGDGNMTTAAVGSVAVGYTALNALTSGARNLAIGYQAGTAITVGENNLAIGYQALDAEDNADHNIAIGNYALTTQNASDGSSANVAIGYQAGLSVTTGQSNTFIGHQTAAEGAGNAITGLYNTAVGAIAGYALEGATASNTLIGYASGTAITTGSENTIVGKGAGAALTAGNHNTVLGLEAFDAAAVGESLNVAIGSAAMSAVDEGTAGGDADFNIAIGYNALLGGDFSSSDLQLQGNIAIGAYALDATAANAQTGTIAIGHNAGGSIAHSDCSGHVLIGHEAGADITNGFGNTAVGFEALNAATTDDYNTAFGYRALHQVSGTNVNYNDGFGYNAGRFCTTGQYNVFVGALAGQGITETKLTGNSNTAVGKGAGLLLQGAANTNTALGYLSGSAITTGNNNTVVGSSAGDALQTGTLNTIIGSGAGASATGATNQTLIGFDCQGVADNSVVLGDGNTIAVYMADDKGADVYCKDVKASGNVGIGLESPSTKLHLWNSSGETTIRVDGGESGVARLMLNADQADDDPDYQDIYAGTDGSMAFRSYSTGAWVSRMHMTAAGEITKPVQPAFSAHPASSQDNIAIDSNVTLVWGTERFDQGGDFASNTFTAPVTGKYQLQVVLRLYAVDSAAAYYMIEIITSNHTYYSIFDPDFGQDAVYWNPHFSVLADMDASDTAYVTLTQSGGTQQTDVNTASWFSGFLVC